MACVRAGGRRGAWDMLGWVVGGVGTFVVSLIFSCMFLQMRCRGVGPPFGPHARPWAIFIAVATALVSAGFGLLILAASHETSAARPAPGRLADPAAQPPLRRHGQRYAGLV